MIHHYFPGRRLKYSYSYSLGQSNSLNATEPAMDKMLHIMSLAVLLNEIPLQAVRGINTHSNLSFQVFLPRHLICGVSLCQLHLPQPCVGHGGSWGWVGAPIKWVLCLCYSPPFGSHLPDSWAAPLCGPTCCHGAGRLCCRTDHEPKERYEVLSPGSFQYKGLIL